MPRDKDLTSTASMKAASPTRGGFQPGKTYVAYDATLGEVEAIFVKTVGAVGIVGSPMYPKLAYFDVAGEFLCDDNEAGSSIIGEEWCIGSWLGGITTAAGFGFVQVKGLNLVALTTDQSVLAKDVVLPTTAIGIWEGVDSNALVTASTNNLATRCGYALADDATAVQAAGSVLWDVHQPGV